MRILYSTTIEDILAFLCFHYKHSPSCRRMLAFVNWSVPIAMGFLITLTVLVDLPLVVLDKDSLDLEWLLVKIFSLVVIAVAWPFFASFFFGWQLGFRVRMLYREGSNSGNIGPHELAITDTHLIERNPYGGQSKVLWAIDRVASGEAHAFVYLTAVTAHIVPFDAIEEGDLRTFIRELKQRMDQVRDDPELPRRLDSATSITEFRRELRGDENSSKESV